MKASHYYRPAFLVEINSAGIILQLPAQVHVWTLYSSLQFGSRNDTIERSDHGPQTLNYVPWGHFWIFKF